MQTLSSTTLKPRSNGGYGNWASASAAASASEHLHLPLEVQQLLPVGAKWQVNKSHLQAIEWHQLPAANEPPRIKSPTHNSMMKLILSLLSLCALAAARPGFLHGHHHHYPEYPLYPHHHHHVEPLHVAKIVHLPAAVSHQSSTVVHSVPHHIIKPVILPTVVKTVVHPPILKAYHPAPLIKAYHPYDPFHLHHHHHDFHDFHHY